MQMDTFLVDARYLGIPLFLSKNKIQDFKFFVNKIHKLLQWGQSALSWVGRYTMITSVL